MKKNLTLLAVLFLTVFSFADDTGRYNDARRFFEIGIDAGVGASNSYFGLNDIFQDELVLDLDKIANELSNRGLSIGADVGASVYTDLNLKYFSVKGFLSVEGLASSSIPKSLIELVAKGNELGRTYTGDLNIRGDCNLVSGLQFKTKITTPIGPFHIAVNPSYFVPIVHIDKPTAEYSILTKKNGSNEVVWKADVPVYTIVPADKLTSGETTLADDSDLLSSGGFDISISADYPLFSYLSVGIYLQSIPVVPAKMHYRTHIISNGEFKMDPVLQDIDLENIDFEDMYSLTQDSQLVYDEQKIQFNRPFKFGIDAAYKPLMTNLLILYPDLALVIYNGVYVNAGLEAQLNLSNIFLFNISSKYEDLTWKQRAGFILNVRVIELEIAAGMQSSSFLKSFSGSGLNMMIGFRMGF